jgi:hypothetical protein
MSYIQKKVATTLINREIAKSKKMMAADSDSDEEKGLFSRKSKKQKDPQDE